MNQLEINGEVLVLVPRTNDGGGASYFYSLRQFHSDKVQYFYRGKSKWPASSCAIKEIKRMILDYFSYICILKNSDFKIIHINTFLGGNGIYRDALFTLIGKIFKKKIIVQTHGWDWSLVNNEKSFKLKLFKKVNLNVDAIIVLSSDEKRKLISWNLKKSIYLETTAVDQSLIENLKIDDIKAKFENGQKIDFLFLSRLHRKKGIYETLDSFKKLQERYPDIRLTIAGKGPELENIGKYLSKNNIKDIEIIGFVSGDQKKSVLKKAHLFLFPSYWSEGMPCAVLEAFAFGLPVVSTEVGGLKDIFKDGENGLVVKMRDSLDLEKKIEKLISDPKIMKKIALNNYNYAKRKFVSSVVVKRIEKIYSTLL